MRRSSALLVALLSLAGTSLASPAIAQEFQTYETYASTQGAYQASLPDLYLYPLATNDGPDISLRASYYHYKEPDVMSIDGATYGGQLGYTHTFAQAYGGRQSWLRAEVLGFYAPDQTYDGGTMGGVAITGEKEDWKIDGRILLGQDLPAGSNLLLAPYIGLGGRYLYDSAGTYRPIGVGYVRENAMLYGIAGIDARFRVLEQTLEWRNEGQLLITGRQKSELSKTSSFVGDINNRQTKGIGYRTHLARLSPVADVGVYYEYMHVGESRTDQTNGLPFIEPENDTNEVGVFLRKRF